MFKWLKNLFKEKEPVYPAGTWLQLEDEYFGCSNLFDFIQLKEGWYGSPVFWTEAVHAIYVKDKKLWVRPDINIDAFKVRHYRLADKDKVENLSCILTKKVKKMADDVAKERKANRLAVERVLKGAKCK